MLFELLFVGYLLKMLDKAELDIDRATNAKVAATAANRILTLFYDAGTALVAYKSAHNPLLLEKYSNTVKSIPQQLNVLQGALVNQNNGPERYRRAAILCERSLDLLDRSAQRAELGDRQFPYEAALPLGTQLDLMSKELVSEMNSLVKEYQSNTHSMEAALASRAQLRVFIFSGTALSIVLAFALALSFRDGTVLRLAVLMENTQHLARKEPLQPLLSGKDEIAQLDKVFHEVNEKLAAADRERKAIEQLKRDFLNMLTHDLRSPLASITAAIEVLQEGVYGELNAQGKNSLELTGASLNYMTRLVDDLLDTERLEAGELPLDKAPQDLQGIAESAISSIKNLLQSRNITVELGECTTEVFADETRIQQVFANLLHNAVKYSPDGATITITFSETPTHIQTEITDQGTGIPDEALPTIFDRFRQVSITDATKKRGSGLGLYFCKQVVELHGGLIGVSSTPGLGSTFWFTLPIYVET